MKKLFYILAIGLMTGCTSTKVRRTLEDVETYISQRPDSALVVIESIDSAQLTNKGVRAHHALLHAMALDKNYIDVADDSLARTAVSYYQKHGPKKRLARSLYYLALSYFNDRQYDKAIIELIKAESVAENSDSLYMGLAKVLQANIHSANYDKVSEIEKLFEALNIYSDIQADNYISVVRHRIARALINNKKYDEAKVILEELLNTENLKLRTLASTMSDYAFLLGTSPNPDYYSSNEYYKKTIALDINCMTTQDYWAWAYSLSKIGKTGTAYQLVDDLKQVDSSGTAYYFMYKIAKNEGRPLEALEHLEKFTNKNNDEVVQVLKQSISTTQKNYYKSQFLAANYKATNRLLSMIIFVVACIAITCFTGFYIIRYRKKKEAEKDEYIRYAEEISRQLKDLMSNSYTALQKKYISMYKTKYETLRSLYERYLISDGRVDADKILYREVVRLINELRHDIQDEKTFNKILDDDLGGIMTLLSTEFKSFSKKDHALIGYLALGFDVVMISHFMNCSSNSVYIRKSRLKKEIKESDAEHKAIFLEILG